MRVILKSLLVASVFPLLTYSSTVLACGGFFPDARADTTISMEAQRAVYHIKESRVEMILQVSTANASSAFAWVIPVPADDSLQLSVTDNKLFEQLNQFTTPEVTIDVSSADTGGGGCGCGDAGDSSKSNDGFGVDVFQQGTVGDYDFAVIGGTEGDKIVEWLSENGFSVPSTIAPTLEEYSTAGLRFVAVKFAEEVVNSSSFGSQPLVIDMARPDMIVYPLGISRISVTDSIPVVLYVLADQRYKSSFSNLDLSDIAKKMRASFEKDGYVPSYVDAVDTETAGAEGRLFVTDFAEEVTPATCESCDTLNARIGSGAYVTRMYANVPADRLIDVGLTKSADADVSSTQFASRTLIKQLAPALAPFFMFFGWLRLQSALRRRR